MRARDVKHVKLEEAVTREGEKNGDRLVRDRWSGIRVVRV